MYTLDFKGLAVGLVVVVAIALGAGAQFASQAYSSSKVGGTCYACGIEQKCQDVDKECQNANYLSCGTTEVAPGGCNVIFDSHPCGVTPVQCEPYRAAYTYQPC